MAQFFNDTFNEAASPTPLSSHTSNSGHTWSIFGGSTTPSVFTAQGGIVAAGSTAISLWKASAVSGASADVKLTSSVYLDTVTLLTQWGLAARMDDASTAGYWAYFTRSTGVWTLARLSNSGLGATTLATSAAQTYTAATTIAVELTVSGSGASVALELKVNGVSLATFNDTDALRVTAAGKVGFSTHANGQGFGWFLSTLTADDAVSAGSSGTGSGSFAAVSLTAPTATAAGGTSSPGNGSGALAPVSLIAATGTAFVPTGSIDLSNATLHVLKNNAGTVYASTAFRCVIVNASTGAFAATKTGTTTAGGLIGVLTDAAFVPGTSYYVLVEPGVAGAYGVFKATAA